MTTLTDQIIAFAGTGVGGVVIGWWINKKKDDIEIALKEQVFYKTLIKDIEDQRNKERQGYEDKISAMSDKITGLKTKIEEFLRDAKDKDVKIKNQEKNLKKWEGYCEQLKSTVEFERKRYVQLDEINQKLEEEVEILKSKNNETK